MAWRCTRLHMMQVLMHAGNTFFKGQLLLFHFLKCNSKALSGCKLPNKHSENVKSEKKLPGKSKILLSVSL